VFAYQKICLPASYCLLGALRNPSRFLFISLSSNLFVAKFVARQSATGRGSAPKALPTFIAQSLVKFPDTSTHDSNGNFQNVDLHRSVSVTKSFERI
jgi:hypothetical protein